MAFDDLFSDPAAALGVGLLSKRNIGDAVATGFGLLSQAQETKRQQKKDDEDRAYRNEMLDIKRLEAGKPKLTSGTDAAGNPILIDKATRLSYPVTSSPAGAAPDAPSLNIGAPAPALPPMPTAPAPIAPPQALQGNPKATQKFYEGYAGQAGKNAAGDPAKAEGQKRFTQAINTIRGYYDELEKEGGVISDKRGPISNTINSIARSDAGEWVGEKLGTKEHTIANNIRSARPVLLQAIAAATGMSAKQLDSNTELKLYLDSLGDPRVAVQSNRDILDRIEKMFGQGGAGGDDEDQEGDIIEGPDGKGGIMQMIFRGGQYVPYGQ